MAGPPDWPPTARGRNPRPLRRDLRALGGPDLSSTPATNRGKRPKPQCTSGGWPTGGAGTNNARR
eukprot:8631147-Lingulodinium_polyedra.AAC.1